jgi:hypothetical protein
MDQLQLYVRLRGTVIGPLDPERLRNMARRGQLSRLHEVSTDGVTWVRAGNYPEIFTSELVVTEQLPPAALAPQPAPAPAAPPVVQDLPSAQAEQPIRPAHPGPKWYYQKDGREVGPVSESVVRQMLASGELTPESFVWHEGMLAWMPAREMDLWPKKNEAVSTIHKREVAGTDSADQLPPLICKAASDSRSWVVFLAITGYIWAGLHIVLGILCMIQGATSRSPPVVANGLLMLLAAAAVATGSTLLLRYAGHLARLQYHASAAILREALENLRTFWIFLSILVIVLLSLLVLLIVVILAGGAAWPGFPKSFTYL